MRSKKIRFLNKDKTIYKEFNSMTEQPWENKWKKALENNRHWFIFIPILYRRNFLFTVGPF